MALTRTTRGTATATGTSNAVTGSFTPSNTSLLVAMVGGVSSGTGDPRASNAMSGGSLTWTKSSATVWKEDADLNAWGSWAEVWTAPVGTGASMTVTSNPGTTQDGHFLSVVEYTGYNTGSPTGTFATGTRSEATGSLTITLATNPASDSEVVGVVGLNNWNPGADPIVAGTGWSAIHDYALIGGETFGHTQARGSSTSTAVLWNQVEAAPDNAAACALEIKADAGGAAGQPTSKRHGGVPFVALPGRGNVWAPLFRSLMLIGPNSQRKAA